MDSVTPENFLGTFAFFSLLLLKQTGIPNKSVSHFGLAFSTLVVIYCMWMKQCNYKHHMGCEAQLTWKCIFTPTFFGWRF